MLVLLDLEAMGLGQHGYSYGDSSMRFLHNNPHCELCWEVDWPKSDPPADIEARLLFWKIKADEEAGRVRYASHLWNGTFWNGTFETDAL